MAGNLLLDEFMFGGNGGWPQNAQATVADMQAQEAEQQNSALDNMLALAQSRGFNFNPDDFTHPNGVAAAMRKSNRQQPQSVIGQTDPLAAYQGMLSRMPNFMQHANQYYQQMLNSGLVPMGNVMGFNPAAPLQAMMPWALPRPQLGE